MAIKVGYVPTGAMKDWAGVHTAVNSLIDHICKGEDFIVYNTYEKALQIKEDYFCGYDTSRIVKVEVWANCFVLFSDIYDEKKVAQFKSYELVNKIKFVD